MVCAAFSLGFPLPAHAVSSADPSMMPLLRAVSEAIFRRPVTPEEWLQIQTDEANAPVEMTPETLKMMEYCIKVLRDEDGTAAAFHLRHAIINSLYYDKKNRHSPIRSKLLALDPVLVADRRRQRILTTADVQAIVSMRKFANSQTSPRDIPQATAEEIEKESDGDQDVIDKGGYLTDLGCEAAAFWTGVTQHWENLSAGEKSTVRKYAKLGLKGQGTLPDKLLLSLVGWSKTELKAKKLAAARRGSNVGALGSSYTMSINNMAHQQLMIGGMMP